MYEDIVSDPESKKRYGARLKEVAARTARAAYKKANPKKRTPGHVDTGYRGKGSKATKRARKLGRLGAHQSLWQGKSTGSSRRLPNASKRNPPIKWLLKQYEKTGRPAHHYPKKKQVSLSGFPRISEKAAARKIVGILRKSRPKRKRGLFNPGFNEFRGRPGKSSYSIEAANGTPARTKEAGGLEELIINGRKYEFNPHKAKLLYSGNRLHIGGVRFNGSGDLGEIDSVAYRADKPHIGAPRSESYIHHFGEEGGKRPRCVVDREGLPKIVGGSYHISPDGIIN